MTDARLMTTTEAQTRWNTKFEMAERQQFFAFLRKYNRHLAHLDYRKGWKKLTEKKKDGRGTLSLSSVCKESHHLSLERFSPEPQGSSFHHRTAPGTEMCTLRATSSPLNLRTMGSAFDQLLQV